jgi:hypothetical protein
MRHALDHVVQVENTVFKVPRYPLTLFESEPFNDILSGREVVTLRDITAFEFRALLKLVFPNPLYVFLSA